jgi:hypothetical protein
MNGLNVIIFSLSVGFLILGIYETMLLGIEYSYTWLAISGALFLYYTLRKRREQESEAPKSKSVKKHKTRR